MRTPLLNAIVRPSEGQLYRVRGECEDIFVFDTYIELVLDGESYIAKELYVPGYGTCSEGFARPNYNYKNQTQEILDMIFAKGSVNLSKWSKIEAPEDFETAYIEAMNYSEREEREAELYG